MSARNQLLASDAHIWTLRGMIAIQFVLIVYLFIWNRNEAQIDRVYVPRDLQAGSYMRINNPTPAVIYQYGLYILQNIYRWRENGAEDYVQNIYQYQHFITPSCRKYLEKDAQIRQREITHRVRTQEEILGRGYQEDRVAFVAPGQWRVWYDLNIHEAIAGVDMKHIPIQWPINVVRYDVDPEKNEWGLAIDCSAEDIPVALDTREDFTKVIP